MSAALLQARAALHQALAAVDEALGSKPDAGAPIDLIAIDEAAGVAGVSEATVRRWAAGHRRGRHPDWFAHLIGGRWHLSRSRFMAFVAGDQA